MFNKIKKIFIKEKLRAFIKVRHYYMKINNSIIMHNNQKGKVDISVIPVLFTTFNRLDYTKESLNSLLNSCEKIIVIDNASEDGTREYLMGLNDSKLEIILNEKNEGVQGAMQKFFDLTKDYEWVGKVDNDTIVPKDWIGKLKICAEMNGLDIVQAKHALIKSTNPDGWSGFVKSMSKISSGVYQNQYVGGSGVLIRRSVISGQLPNAKWVLGGWFDWQLKHPEVRKGFCEAVEIKLLDTDEEGEDYSKYPDYYKFTKRN